MVADLYQVSQPTVSRVYRRLMPLLDEVLCLHEPAFVDILANRETLVDGTDVPTGNRAGMKENCSGKRHRLPENRDQDDLRPPTSVERAIAHLKNWKILATGYRGHLAELPNIIRIVARLEFYRLGW